ncbi:probable serine/threonine-protein kinase PBL3 isoform X1 [Fagus crenata]
MSEEAQRVLVIQDASRDVSSSAIRWTLQGLSLKPGDVVTLLGVLHQVNNPSTFSFMRGRLLGYKNKADITSMFGANRKIVEDELAKKNEEYHNDEEIKKIAKQFETEKIEFHMKVHAGPCPKIVALTAAIKLRPTWVILHRSFHVVYQLSRMKSNNRILKLRRPKEIGSRKLLMESTVDQVTYNEMVPGSPDDEQSSSREDNATNTEQETAGERSPFSIAENQESSQKKNFTQGAQMNNKRSKATKVIGQNELQAATDGFSQKSYLSEGGFGSVYRGELNGLKIAVKQHKNASLQGEKEFKSEVHVLSKARHQNLVRLFGSCSEGSHRLLVYEYVCHGSLDQHLSRHNCRPPSWEKRMKIAIGAAKGLQYLHENKIIHRDMRPNNILITHDHEALIISQIHIAFKSLGDFGLARTQREDTENSSDTRVVGTLGYLMDVYAIGVVLLQIITGMSTTDKRIGGKSLVGWARPLLKEKNYPDLIDPRIMDSHDFHQLLWMVRVAEKCLARDPTKRLMMEKVVDALDYIMECNPTCGIKDFSPPHSDSVSSMPGSCESEGTMPDIDGSFSIEATSMSSMSQMSVRLPSSPPTQTNSSISSSVSILPEQSTLGGKKGKEKGIEESQNKSELLYDEMLMYI